MGYIIKPIGKISIRVDNYQILSKARQLETDKLLIQKRDGFDIIVYPEENEEFIRFYTKHSERNSKDRSGSVLVLDNTFKPDPNTTRVILEQALREAMFSENKLAYTSIPQIKKGHLISVRKWNFKTEEFEGPPKDCCFVFRDVEDVTSLDKLMNKKRYISMKHLNEILSYITKAKNLEEIYFIRRVLFIGKYFVAA